ncbi:thiamine phosphate synthase [Silvibacterium acidisoli]|uniref:thiamine phosphate synthase n=1 Tax=Acidobacteriaceae bacterium ZG23-2 TaxID=2883246 RepID=UPI00406D3157
MLLYAITDRKMLPGNETERQAALVSLATAWAHRGVNYLQIREKDLEPAALLPLAARIVQAVRETGEQAHIMLNGPAQIALESGCDGVHLPGSSTPGAAEQVRDLFRASRCDPIVSAACHSLEEVERLRSCSLLLFAPVFEKRLSGGNALSGTGIEELHKVCRAAETTPVFALGGVTWANALQCIKAGATGIAGIRLFLDMPQNKLEPGSESKSR